MKKAALLNSHVSQVIATMGHFDLLTVNDAGMPIPNDDRRIDLAVTKALPLFIDVLATLLEELKIQKIYLAEEIKTHNPTQLKQIKTLIDQDVEIAFIPHSEMKSYLSHPLNKGNIRTGEITPFSNIILESDVTF
ncbi:D-ribose pyranase [Staphylococcus pseudintermedius]|uniref:D-ribose pyranase n=1 Tax=Staphylococcus pseudintermedius TaxID=283734 RepID=UPI000B8D7FBE|nr:D-ribose pyranase [Staphylococcus pseudintermedius]ASQ50881.1 D-ribose pyranase [Staphylococcus pseudintermedius]EGQ0296664.1 D-ribose pyranase [Staphylococcus pseudintermedius]EGQ0376227.1 D-ribose pyranase [Staphylococcus pseudintermedius]EGQ1627239.1 D-ribose pyranase [Staphylococcus pseudintermedius]EGQ1776430.1 D-ribose pyranase [Staphylococcus pseudintermedius]